nr:MAG TPA: hypothetical protein [Caudoviricetes sp.]
MAINKLFFNTVFTRFIKLQENRIGIFLLSPFL